MRYLRGGSSGRIRELAYYLTERNIYLYLRRYFVLVARPTDRLLQAVLLLGLRITQIQHLSFSARRRIGKELEELWKKMDQKRSILRNPHRAPVFNMAG